MRLCSRELFVGFLLVLALAAVACQPIAPVSSEVTAVANVGENGPASEVISATTTVTNSVVVAASSGVSETQGGVPAGSSTISATTVVTASVAVSGSAVASATSASGSAGTVTADPALMAVGLATYRAQYCGVCHTLAAAETRGTFGPPHDGMGANAATHLADPNYAGAATTPAEYVRESIVDPQAFIVPGFATTSHRMPSYAHLDAASLDALVAFLLAQ